MNWKSQLRNDPMPWLLERTDPGPRYLTLRDLVGLPPDDPELVAAQKAALSEGPASAILEAMHPDGYWERPGAGYNPKYYSAVWSLSALSQMGASASMDERIAQACAYLLDNSLTPHGQFSTNGTPSYTIDCLQGNMCAALVLLGFDDTRLEAAYEWMARSLTGEGIAPASETGAQLRYYAYKCGPVFACGANGRKACAWGAAKVMRAFSLLPPAQRTPLIAQAIQQGVGFLFSTDPALADYPTRTDSKPNRGWWKFGFPVFYMTDVLQVVEALVALGYAADPRLVNALQLVCDKQDEQGRWALEYDYAGKTWGDYGVKEQPNKWVTLRVLKVLKRAGG